MKARLKVVVVLIAVLSFASTTVLSGISTAQVVAETGRSTFFDGDHFDPCLAAVAGITFYVVRWFNDQALTVDYGKGKYIFATEHNASDPRDKPLIASGSTYAFIDPNGAQWTVQEWYWQDTPTQQSDASGMGLPPPVPSDPTHPHLPKIGATANVSAKSNRTYAWTVAVGKPLYDKNHGLDPHGIYNFVLLLNVCKMHNDTATFAGTGRFTQTDAQAPTNAPDEMLGSFFVDLYVGDPPKGAILGTDAVPNSLQWGTAGGVVIGNNPPNQHGN
ncbi:MAG: hypothetical protein ACYDCK_06090 [Thermoplasmatota archaeon]